MHSITKAQGYTRNNGVLQ